MSLLFKELYDMISMRSGLPRCIIVLLQYKPISTNSFIDEYFSTVVGH